MRPLFLAIEGLDGSGGTTQARRLANWLRGQGAREVVETCEPSPGPVGRFIRSVLSAEGEASRVGDGVLPYLFAADRRDHVDQVVIPALQSGACVVTDRYYHSSLAYQSIAAGLPAVAALNEPFPAPDLTVFLDLDPEACFERVAARGEARERFEALDRLRRVADAYEAVLGHCRAKGERIARVPADGTPDEVHARVVHEVLALDNEAAE